MAGTQQITVDMPSDLVAALGSPEDAAARLRQLAVLDLLKQHKISQGKACELLQLHRTDLWQMMAEFDIPVVDMTPEELDQDLATLKAMREPPH